MRFASTCREPRRCAGVVRLTAGAAIVLAFAGHVPAQTTFRSGSDLVALQVTVVDAERRFVPDLQPQDFTVLEEGVPQIVSLFAAGSTPLDVMLLLDTSASMYDRLPSVRNAAVKFVRALKPDDRAAVIFFSRHVRVVHALTDPRSGIERAIEAASPGGGTALYEALYVALKELGRVPKDPSQPRRQAIVVLTDGDDNGSHVSFEDVLADARGAAVTIYSVVPPTQPVSLARDDDTTRRTVPPFEIRNLSEETGGRIFMPALPRDLGGVYGEIADELSHQYWLAYVPPPPTGNFRRVAVRILSQPTLQARTRSGYYARASRLGTPARIPR